MPAESNLEWLVAAEDLPEAGLLKGDLVYLPPGLRPQVLRPWRGNPGLLLNLACDDKLRFVGDEGANGTSPEDALAHSRELARRMRLIR